MRNERTIAMLSMPAKRTVMKNMNPAREPVENPSRIKCERPDNGVKRNKEFGPSSDAHKDNPHRQLSLAYHAR